MSYRRIYKCFILFLFGCCYLEAQVLTGISAVWDDSPIEWEIFTDQESELGELNMRRNGVWDFSLNESSAQIKMRWEDKPEEWQLMGDGQSIIMRTVFRNDFSAWRIRHGGKSYTFQSKWKNQLETWQLRDTNDGIFEVYTVNEGDPRDWFIVDELKDNIPLVVKMGMVFIAIYHGWPSE